MKRIAAVNWDMASLLSTSDHAIADDADFRPDYKKLGSLKTLFPNVPIQAVVSTILGARTGLMTTLDSHSEHENNAGPAQDPQITANLRW
jgi:hypothetical protein